MALQIRKTQKQEIDTIMAMFDHSRRLMRASGNQHQWVGGYPQRSIAESDIVTGQSYIVTDGDTPVGTFVFFIGTEPTYRSIYHGHWVDEEISYGTLHRMAKTSNAHGIADVIIKWCATQAPSLRADTHIDNHIVQHILERNNFIYCGMIQLEDHTWRKAYQRIQYPIVADTLQQHIQADILPCYDHFDAAHGRQHALTVIAQSMALARHHNVAPDMTYTIAAYHDIGLSEGREKHHIISGQCIRQSKKLIQWFDASQIETMAQAVEDHRASSDHAPRSIYGCIIAEADRDIDAEKIVLRTIQYGLEHYPHLNKEEQWARTLQHLHEKYAEGGYMKLWIDNSPNAQRLIELRTLIKDEKRLRKLFDTIL